MISDTTAAAVSTIDPLAGALLGTLTLDEVRDSAAWLRGPVDELRATPGRPAYQGLATLLARLDVAYELGARIVNATAARLPAPVVDVNRRGPLRHTSMCECGHDADCHADYDGPCAMLHPGQPCEGFSLAAA